MSAFNRPELLMNIRNRVELNQSECDKLEALLEGGRRPIRRQLSMAVEKLGILTTSRAL